MQIHHTIEALNTLKLHGMATALQQQLDQAHQHDGLSFEERIGLLIDRETTDRHNRKTQRLLKAAKFKLQANLNDIQYRASRGLDKSQMAQLTTMTWVQRGQNLIITGSTGCGKSYLACALGRQACQQAISVKYFRASRLFDALTIAQGDGTLTRFLQRLANTQLLIIDDWALETLTQSQRNNLLDIIDDRHGQQATLIATQVPIEHWHEAIGEPTIADAVLDRLLHNAHRIQLQGESMRKITTSLDHNDHDPINSD